MTHHLFVYGTLQRGYGNHRLLEGADYLGKAESYGQQYVMWGTGFPFLAENNRGHGVRGEVYKIDDFMLHECDRLEGHPDWYRREKRSFRLLNNQIVNAWVYLQPYDRGMARLFRRPVNGILEWRTA